MPFPSQRSLALIVVLAITAACGPALADRFLLVEGGSIEGKLVERGSKGEYVVTTGEGATVTLSKKQVRKIEPVSEHQPEYESRSRALPDTVAAHRAMADWCQEHQLGDLADHHLQRLLELDPEDQQARASLGYQRFQGRWLTRDEVMAARGLQVYEGTYRTAQDIALRERAKSQAAVENEWFRQIRQWRDWLDSRREDRQIEAQQQIEAITDPAAAVALVKILDSERDEDFRLLWIKVIAQLDHPLAVRTLIELSLDEPEQETRLKCLDYLLSSHRSIDIAPYIKSLGSRDNETVNIAAEALGIIGDPDAISSLIDAVSTSHLVPNPDAAPGNTNASFSPDGSGGAGFSAGGGPPLLRIELDNTEVHLALVKLSGDQDYGFNREAWRRWFVNQQINEEEFVDARRDK